MSGPVLAFLSIKHVQAGFCKCKDRYIRGSYLKCTSIRYSRNFLAFNGTLLASIVSRDTPDIKQINDATDAVELLVPSTKLELQQDFVDSCSYLGYIVARLYAS